MTRRNLSDDPASLDFVSNFAPRPLRDGTVLRLFTGQRQQLAGLLCRNLRRSTWARLIGEPLDDGPIGQRNSLLREPALAPDPHCFHAHALLLRNLTVILAGIRCQDGAARSAICCGVWCHRTRLCNSLRSFSFKLKASGFGPRMTGSSFCRLIPLF